MKNLIFAYISTIPFIAATIDAHDIGYLAITAIFSIILMALGKLGDFAIKFYLIRYTNRTRRDPVGIASRSDRGSLADH